MRTIVEERESLKTTEGNAVGLTAAEDQLTDPAPDELRIAVAESGQLATHAVVDEPEAEPETKPEPDAKVDLSKLPKPALNAAGVAIMGAYNGQRHSSMTRRSPLGYMGNIRIPRSANPIRV